MWDVLARQLADGLTAQTECHVGKRSPGKVHDRPSQCLVQWGERPPEAIDSAPLSQGAIERFTQRQATVLDRMMIVHVQVAFAGQHQVEPSVAAQRVEEMIQEPDPCLDGRLSTSIEIDG